MAGKRTIELGLAAGISLTAILTAFAPLTQAGIFDVSSRDMVLAEFADNPVAPMQERTRAVVGSLMAPGSPGMSSQDGFGVHQDENDAPALTLSSEQMDFAVVPRVAASQSDGGQRRVMGFQITAEPAGADQRWWLVAGAERETYVVAPGDGFRELNLTQVGGSAALGDAHVGIAFEVTDGAYASVGYVQQRRHFQLGTQDWEEQDHFVGAAFRARW